MCMEQRIYFICLKHCSFVFVQVHLFHRNEWSLCFSQALWDPFAFLLNQRPTLICRTHHPSKRDSMAPRKTREPSATGKGSYVNPAATCLDDHLAVKWSDIENQGWEAVRALFSRRLSRNKLSVSWLVNGDLQDDDSELKVENNATCVPPIWLFPVLCHFLTFRGQWATDKC